LTFKRLIKFDDKDGKYTNKTYIQTNINTIKFDDKDVKYTNRTYIQTNINTIKFDDKDVKYKIEYTYKQT
jgi:hypothetical protein